MMTFSDVDSQTVKVTSETESHFTAVERVKFYEQEIPLEVSSQGSRRMRERERQSIRSSGAVR